MTLACLGGFGKQVIWMILSKKAKVITTWTLKVAKTWTAHEKCTDSFKIDIFMIFAELYKGFVKWPWLTS